MAKENKEKLQKKLEALKRLQQASAILQEGGIQNQALQTSADDQWPTGDAHLLDLLEKSKIKAPEAKRGAELFENTKSSTMHKKSKSTAGAKARTAKAKPKPKPKPKQRQSQNKRTPKTKKSGKAASGKRHAR
ncbi:MAG: hypothetical protein ACP5T3_03270 [Candidatus Micrarchaeia archaeon]